MSLGLGSRLVAIAVVDLKPFFQQAYDQGARIHTNSWGDQEDNPIQNNYTTASQDVDEFMWNHPDFLIFFAALIFFAVGRDWWLRRRGWIR